MFARWVSPAAKRVWHYMSLTTSILNQYFKRGQKFVPAPSPAHRAIDCTQILTEPGNQCLVVSETLQQY